MDPIQDVLDRAKEIALDKKHTSITTSHFAMALLSFEDIQTIINSYVSTDDNVIETLKAGIETCLVDETLAVEKTNVTTPQFTLHLIRVLERSVVSATFNGRTEPNHLDLFIGLLGEPDIDVIDLFAPYGITKDTLSEVSEPAGVEEDAEHGSNNMAQQEDKKSKSESKVLEEFTTNLNLAAASGDLDPIVGRDEIVESVVQTLSRRKKSNIILTGEPGVGKTAIAEGLAQRIVDGQVPAVIQSHVIYSLDVGSLIAGTRYRGDFEQRIKTLIEKLEKTPRAILFIDEIHMIMGAGSSSDNKIDIANILKPALQRGSIKCIGSTTDTEYRSNFEKDRALARRFLKINIPEPSVEQAIEMVAQTIHGYESFYDFEFTEEAIAAACELSDKYMHDKQLPDKAFDLIDGTAARQKILPTEIQDTTITADHIRRELARITRIPVETIIAASQAQDSPAIDIEREIQRQVFGQDAAINKLSDNVYISQAGLKSPKKPVGSYLFTGPTGVGKTETARALSTILNKPLVKFDMSEYQEKHSVAKLIGAPPGYVGYGDGENGDGALVNQLETNPNCILLLDEVEKAHPDALQILLQVLDEGLLSSSNGKQVSARNAIIIMTSNLGAHDSEAAVIGFTGGRHDEAQDEAVKQFFSPEFRNRLDGIIQFNKISHDVAVSIVEKFLRELYDMCGTKNIKLKWHKKALDKLAEDGFDDLLGARPLYRLIQEKVKKPLAKKILFSEEEISEVTITIKNNELNLNYRSRTREVATV